MSKPPVLNYHQNKALRLLRLLEILQQKAWRPHELRQELGLGERAIFDYLNEVKALVEWLGLRLIHDELRSTYQIEVEERLSLTETVVAFTALRMLAHHSPGSNKAYQEALRKLAKNLPEALKVLVVKSTEAQSQRPPSFNGLNLEKITEAWLKRRVIGFEYRLPGSSRIIKVELEVYFIEVSRANMAVYIIGKDLLYGRAIHYRDNLKTYKLDRIHRVQLRETEYSIPDDFDPSQYLSTAWGIVSGEKPVEVKLKFAPEAAHRIREGGYPNLKELGQLEGGYTLVEITVGTDESGFPLELLPWIQSWGPRVEVLEPASLREKWLGEARALVERFGGENQSPKTRQYWAHTHKDRSKWQTLQEHATEVARLASAKAAFFGEENRANLAGLLHDIGKYGDLFQRRLEGSESGLDHWSAGAHLALFNHRDIPTALAIQGHHIGLQSGAKQSLEEMSLGEGSPGKPKELRLSETDLTLLQTRLQGDGIALPEPTHHRLSPPSSAAEMLDTRMLFSALVDADFLDTERTMNQGNEKFISRPTTPTLQASRALELLEARLAELNADQSIPQKTRDLRRDLAQDCAQAASHPARVFTLTAPTGTGKTLSMLRFALTRAAQDPRVRRVVVVLPYLSILDQTVDIYRKLFAEFGDHYILEHHSLAGLRREERPDDGVEQAERQRKLLSENWDAPVVITTSVQFLESLHANRPSACRKLHNLAGSIVLFDEVQTLPTQLAVPTLKTLSRLASDKYGSTVLFSTATQPAFDTLSERVGAGEPEGTGWQPHEIVVQGAELYAQARRVESQWLLESPTSWTRLVEVLQSQPQALCIVNLKRHAYALIQEARNQGPEGIHHLSTALCPQHRRDKLAQITGDLKLGRPCRVFATQCVEAGVDLDFPHVYRALAPLDAIAQAAGRCNRHATRESGTLTVFVPEEEKYPSQIYQQAAELTRSLLREGGLDLDDPETYRRFYKSLYAVAKTTDKELEGYLQSQNYAEFAQRYRLIETTAVNVVVPYNAEAQALIQEARDQGITADWMRRARGYTVSHHLKKGQVPLGLETVFLRYSWKNRTELPDWFLCGVAKLYDPELGFMAEEGGAADALVL